LGQNNFFIFNKIDLGEYLLDASIVIELILKVLGASLHEALGEDLGFLVHVNFTLTGDLMWPTLIIFIVSSHPQ
jgi:hypothetical protein